jgi:hypothetical protein
MMAFSIIGVCHLSSNNFTFFSLLQNCSTKLGMDGPWNEEIKICRNEVDLIEGSVKRSD